MSVDSTDYRVYKYTTDFGSVNHPSFDKASFGTLSTAESVAPPSQTKSESAKPPYYGSSSSDKADSSKSEPLGKKSVMPLTEQTLALHNDAILSSHRYQIQKKTKVEEEKLLEKALLEKVNERCDDIQLDFEEKIKQLEAQFTKAELDFDQSRNELYELNSMEKEYITQGVQTELHVHDIDKVEKDLIQSKEQTEEWKYKAEGLQEFVNQTKRIIWDTPFIPVNAICRQLPTTADYIEDDDDLDICDYHRERIEKYKIKQDKERELYRDDNNATLNRMSNWSHSIKHQ